MNIRFEKFERCKLVGEQAINDFRVIVDGVHRATWKRRYKALGYILEVSCGQYRESVQREFKKPFGGSGKRLIQIASQNQMQVETELALAEGLIPSIEDLKQREASYLVFKQQQADAIKESLRASRIESKAAEMYRLLQTFNISHPSSEIEAIIAYIEEEPNET